YQECGWPLDFTGEECEFMANLIEADSTLYLDEICHSMSPCPQKMHLTWGAYFFPSFSSKNLFFDPALSSGYASLRDQAQPSACEEAQADMLNRS
ncbi:hypothetical protein CROQUDRAFT_50832, partial [Cronartium quercuum f. sp. fusiforme G11]